MTNFNFPLNIKTANSIKVVINNFKSDFINGLKFTVTSHVQVSFSDMSFKVHGEHSEDNESVDSLNMVMLDYLISAIEQCTSQAELEQVVFLARRGLKKGDNLEVTDNDGKQYKAVVVGHWGSVTRVSKITKSGKPSKATQCLYGNYKFIVNNNK